jgi:protein SCO1/2
MLRPTRSARPRRSAVILGLGVGFVLLGLGVGVGLHLLLERPASAVAGKAGASRLDGEATWAAGARPAPAIGNLRDQSGRLFSLSSLRGRTVVIAFLDSHCTQACPREGRALAAAEAAVPRAQRPTLVAISVNPLDTPASARAALRKWGLAQVAAWHWLMGARARLAPVWRVYHEFVYAPPHGDIVHTESLLLLDRHGNERSGYLYPFVPGSVAHDLRILAKDRPA